MKIAIAISGAVALILAIIGWVFYVRAHKNDDVKAKIKASITLRAAIIVGYAFFVLFAYMLLQVLFAVLQVINYLV